MTNDYEVIRNRYYDDTKVVDGVRYTTKEEPNKLTNEDFLELLMEELKNQDPTKPKDSAAMMESQLKMSTIEANQNMSDSMASLQKAFAASSLTSTANLIGKIVEDGQTGEDGVIKSYKVETVESVDGELYVNTKQMVGFVDTLYDNTAEKYVLYDGNGYILDDDGKKTEIQVKMEEGRFVLEDGKIVLLDKNGDKITDQTTLDKYKTDGAVVKYDDEYTKLQVANLTKIR
jgi:flagellar basal-body rod modification protein FlgD